MDKCRVWESHEEQSSRSGSECEPVNSRGVFQVREQGGDDHSGRQTEPDSNYSNVGNLANRLREMVQQPGMEGSGSIDIRHLLRRLLPIDTDIRGAGQLTSEAEAVAEHESGNVD